ncbi:MAG: hypothetical protein DRR04_13995, partial [Gammaproteobacteria bacterium]
MEIGAFTDKIQLVSFKDYDLGFLDEDVGRVDPADNPFMAKVLTMSSALRASFQIAGAFCRTGLQDLRRLDKRMNHYSLWAVVTLRASALCASFQIAGAFCRTGLRFS